MADKSAFVPVDAIGNHKNTDLDVDIDDELFGKKPPPAAAPAAPAASSSKMSAPVAAKPISPAPKSPAAPAPAAAAPKYQYKKSTTYSKSYAK